MVGRLLLARLRRRAPTRDEAFDSFAGPLGGVVAGHEGAAAVSGPAAGRSPVSSDVAKREQARAQDGELVRSVRLKRVPTPVGQPWPASTDAADEDGEKRTAPSR